MNPRQQQQIESLIYNTIDSGIRKAEIIFNDYHIRYRKRRNIVVGKVKDNGSLWRICAEFPKELKFRRMEARE